MSYAVSITQDGTNLKTAGKYVDQDIVVGISDSIKKPAATYTPSTTDQTITAGQFLSGAQTIKGDTNLIAANIRSGKSIFGVAGSLTPGITPIDIDAISIINVTTPYGVKNGVVVDVRQKDIRKINVTYKQLTTQGNDMIVSSATVSSSTTSPWISTASNGGWNSCTVETRTVGDYTELIATVNSSLDYFFRFGNWTDSSYSTTNAFRSIQLYDTSSTLIRDIVPVSIAGVPYFMDKLTSKLYGCTNPNAIAIGEATA